MWLIWILFTRERTSLSLHVLSLGMNLTQQKLLYLLVVIVNWWTDLSIGVVEFKSYRCWGRREGKNSETPCPIQMSELQSREGFERKQLLGAGTIEAKMVSKTAAQELWGGQLLTWNFNSVWNHGYLYNRFLQFNGIWWCLHLAFSRGAPISV